MRVKLLKDTTLTAKAGSVVEIDDSALRFLAGRVEVVPDPVAEPEPAKEKKKARKKAGK
jgi:hypothetical protein